MFKHVVLCLLLTSCVLSGGVTTLAQQGRGSLSQPDAAVAPGSVSSTGPAGTVVSGHVRGPGGVSVPGATVVLLDPRSGARKETWSDESGNFVFRGVAPGTYRLEVSLVGFQTDVREPVPAEEGQPLTVNVALTLARAGGAVSQGEGSRGRPSIPLAPNGLPDLSKLSPEARQQLQTMAAQASAASALGGLGGAGGEGESLRFSESGAMAGGISGEDEAGLGSPQASAANSFLLSGSVAEAPTPGQDQAQLRERFQQFREQQQGAPGFGPTASGSGGRGGGPGGGGGETFQNAMIFFSGLGGRRPRVNRLRGNVFERYTNSAFDALPYPLNVPESRQIASYSEQAGFSIGGPLNIPHVYNGKDKTSFFVHYNLQRSRSPFDSYSTVPTLLERTGNFSETVVPSGPLAGMTPVIYQPQSGSFGPRTPFPGNQIPATMFNPASVGLLQYIPLPNLPGSVQNFHLQEALPAGNDRVMARIGRELSRKDNLSAFYFFNSSRSTSVSSLPAFTSNTSVRSQNFNLIEIHTFNPQIINSLAFNFNRQRTSLLNPFANKQDVAAALGITGVSEAPLDWGVPAVDFTNFAALNLAMPSLTRNQTTRAFDFVTLNHSKHNFRFGGELRRVQVNTLTDPDARGTFVFNGYTTSDFTANGQPVPGTGFDFADFLLGLPQATSVRFGTSANYLRSWVYSGFVQDDWRASSRLTFDYGLRYEFFQPFTEKYRHLSDLEIGAGFSSAGVVTGLNPDPFPASLLRADANNFAPRFGLAFRPWTKRQLVLRAGYGIFYDGSIYNRLVPNLESQPPFAQASTLLTSPSQLLTLQNGFPAVGPNILTNTYAVDPNFRTPYAQTWNFNVQDELVRNVILTIGYVGTKGSKLDLLLGPNPAGSNHTANALQYDYETSGASSIYHALQVSLHRQFRSGLSFRGSYTYSKSIDDAASVGGAGSVVAQNYLDLAAERSLSVFNRTHQFLMNYNYELPFGDRKPFLSHGGALARAFGNWQVSGVTTLESGTPFTARVLGNTGSTGGTGAYFSLRANATGLPVTLPSSERTALDYFNTAAFTLPPTGQLGNAGRNTIPGPPMYNFNVSLDRQIIFSRERGMTGDFRIEANNIFNTPNFMTLATVVNATSFGRVTSVNTMRTIAFSLRFRF
jgi:Carboxypeptidase regulatory-like domain